MKEKEIRFIDSGYNEVFKIPDGGRIYLNMSNGEKHLRQCEYIDDYHFKIYNPEKPKMYNVMHICQFAENMERNGTEYAPVITQEFVLESASADEIELSFANRSGHSRGCMGRFSGDYNRRGSAFWTSWNDETKDLQTEDFRAECNEVINYFRTSKDMPLLKTGTDMRRICREVEGLRLEDMPLETYLYKVKTVRHTYFIRCCPVDGHCKFDVYAYNSAELWRYTDIRFAEKHLTEPDIDKFFKTDSGFTEVYYNPDAAAGGQLVYIEISAEDVKEAARKFKSPEIFFAYLEGCGREYLIDAGTPEFRGNLESFIKRKADFEGATKKTMQSLMKESGVKIKDKELER